MRQVRGVTLIALIITIIVLVILSVVTISILTGENGILTKTKQASQIDRAKKIKEVIELWKLEKDISEYNEDIITLEEKLNELIEQQTITVAEKKEILRTGKLTVGEEVIPIIKFKIYGESEQESEPTTPETPVPVYSLGERTRNLAYKTIAGGSINESGVIIQDSLIYGMIVAKVNAGDIISISGTSMYAYIYGWFTEEPFIGSQTLDLARHIVNSDQPTNLYGLTVPNGANYVVCRMKANGNGQIEQGSSPTPYIPYNAIEVVSSGKKFV